MRRKIRSTQQNKPPKPEELGKMLASIYESGYLNRTQAYKMSFIKGVVGGFGGAIGATVVVALVIWLLSLFSSVPVVGRVIDNVRRTVNTESR